MGGGNLGTIMEGGIWQKEKGWKLDPPPSPRENVKMGIYLLLYFLICPLMLIQRNKLFLNNFPTKFYFIVINFSKIIKKQYLMSRFLPRKVNKQPIRSPSPDIANRHIITRTNSPINEAMTKLRLSKSSKYPLGHSFLNNEQYQAFIKELQLKIKLLTQDNHTLYEEAQRQSKEIDFLKEINLKHRKQIYKKSQSQRSQSQRSYPEIQYSPDILSQYQSRIGLMSEEVKRIHDLLATEKRKNEGLTAEIQNLQRKGKERKGLDPALKKELTQIQESLLASFDKLLDQYQNKVDMVIQDEITKVNEVENNQRNILKLLENRKKYDSPSITDKSWKNNHNSTAHRTPVNSFKVREQSQECLNCRLYLLKISDLQSKITELQHRIRLNSSPSGTKSNSSNLQSYLEKLSEIKMILTNQEIIDSINIIQQNLSEIYSIDEKFQIMKEQKNSIIQELRQKEVQQMLQITALRKERQVLKIQIKEQIGEIEKLKELLNLALKSPRKQEDNLLRKSNTEGQTLRKYIQEAVSRINSLEDQVEKDLNL